MRQRRLFLVVERCEDPQCGERGVGIRPQPFPSLAGQPPLESSAALSRSGRTIRRIFRNASIFLPSRRSVRPAPDSQLDRQLPNRPRSWRVLLHHMFQIPIAFLDAEDHGEVFSQVKMLAGPPSDTLSSAEIAAFGEGVRARFNDWWAGAAGRPIDPLRDLNVSAGAGHPRIFFRGIDRSLLALQLAAVAGGVFAQEGLQLLLLYFPGGRVAGKNVALGENPWQLL